MRDPIVTDPEVQKQHLIGFLQQIAAMMPNGLEALLLKHGRWFHWDKDRDAKRKRGAIKQCFSNAGSRSLDQPGWYYCEGFAIGDAVIPVQHAWLCDDSGEVCDCTWRAAGSRNARAYFGCAIKPDSVRKRALESKYWGFFYPAGYRREPFENDVSHFHEIGLGTGHDGRAHPAPSR